MLNLLRIIGDWLKDPELGVNAMIRLTPRDPGEPEPKLVAFIGDSTRDAVVARCVRRRPSRPCSSRWGRRS